MAENILDSYFVKVSAFPDAKSFGQMANILARTELSIAGVSHSALKSIVAFEVASITAFAAIAVGLISLADKTAMTDQSYRLMGMRMLMTKDTSRAMQQALDELGATIDEVAYDPELNQRFQYLYEENIKLGKQLGTNFDVVERNVRDIRMEYKRFGNELEMLSYGAISQLFTKLGFGNQNLLQKLNSLNDWFTAKLPAISDFISTQFIPVWNGAITVLSTFGDIVKMAAGDFQLMTGLLSGDDSLENTNVSVKSLTETFQIWVRWITDATLAIEHLAESALHEINALSFGLKGAWEYAKNTDESVARAHILWGRAGLEMDKSDSDMMDVLHSDRGLYKTQNTKGEKATDLASLIDTTARRYNLNPELLAAITHQEDPSHDPGILGPLAKGQHAMGLMQLMPDTAKQYGATNPFNPEQNMDAGAHYFADLLNQFHGDTTLALAAYNAGPGAVKKYGDKVPPYAQTEDYVTKILRQFGALSEESDAKGGQVVIDTVNIHVPHALPEKEWHKFVRDSMTDVTDRDSRSAIAQQAGAYF